MNDAPPKGRKFYEVTISNARAKAQLTSKNADFLEAAHAGEITEKPALLDGLSDLLGMPIEAVLRVDGADACSYRVVSGGKARKIASADCLLNFRAFQRVA